MGGATDTEPPLILDSIPLRAEVDDQILIKGNDLGGITRLGYIVSNLSGTVVSGDSITFGGTNTNEEVRFTLRFDTVVTTFPTQLVLTTFGLDGAANRGANSLDGLTAIVAPGQADTITVVAGRTELLPTGGAIADAIVNRNLGTAGEIYLTNVDASAGLNQNRFTVIQQFRNQGKDSLLEQGLPTRDLHQISRVVVEPLSDLAGGHRLSLFKGIFGVTVSAAQIAMSESQKGTGSASVAGFPLDVEEDFVDYQTLAHFSRPFIIPSVALRYPCNVLKS